jgi:hypothetical protein
VTLGSGQKREKKTFIVIMKASMSASCGGQGPAGKAVSSCRLQRVSRSISHIVTSSRHRRGVTEGSGVAGQTGLGQDRNSGLAAMRSSG